MVASSRFGGAYTDFRPEGITFWFTNSQIYLPSRTLNKLARRKAPSAGETGCRNQGFR
jgi:hypothetical protein